MKSYGGIVLKKVMVSLTLLAVLIVGTSVGVAVSASHLRENEVLDAGDIWLAMASQGLLAWPVPGDYSDLAVGDVEPVMYKAGGIYLAVYEFADAQQRYALNYSYVWREKYQLLISKSDFWRNLGIVYAVPFNFKEQRMVQTEAAFQQLIEVEEKIERQSVALCRVLNHVQRVVLEVESETMRYTLEQNYFCQPVYRGADGKGYDCGYQVRMLDCQYKEPPEAREELTRIYLVLGQKTGEQKMVYDDLLWNGQGVVHMGELSAEKIFCGQRLTDAPMALRYRINFKRAGLEEEAKAAYTMEPWE